MIRIADGVVDESSTNVDDDKNMIEMNMRRDRLARMLFSFDWMPWSVVL